MSPNLQVRFTVGSRRAIPILADGYSVPRDQFFIDDLRQPPLSAPHRHSPSAAALAGSSATHRIPRPRDHVSTWTVLPPLPLTFYGSYCYRFPNAAAYLTDPLRRSLMLAHDLVPALVSLTGHIPCRYRLSSLVSILDLYLYGFHF